MSYSAALELVLDDLPGGEASAAALPPGAPARLDRANVTLNHGLLVGELLGIPISQAQRIIDGVSARADTDPCFHVDEQQTLRVAYSAILRALEGAIEEDGTPAPNPAGQRLAASDLIMTAGDGSLVIEHRRVPLRALGQQLRALVELLSFAIERQVRVRME